MLFRLGGFCVEVVMMEWELCCMKDDCFVLLSVVGHLRFGGEGV